MWPFNYPGDDYSTNVFNQIIIFVEDLSDEVKETIEFIKGEILNET